MDLQGALDRRMQVEDFQRRHRSKLVTMLFSDIVGSTKLKQILGDRGAIDALQRHHALFREALRGFAEGEEIGTAGDAFFIVFAKPSDAVKYALLVQFGLRRLAEETGHAVLDRIGIHVGEVWVDEASAPSRGKDLYGIQVDTCARVSSLGGADQILLTRFAFDSARQVLRGEDLGSLGPLSWLNHGPYVMKGVEEPLEVCEVGETGKAALTRPADTEKVHRFISADSEPVLGWRPAVDQSVPGTSWVLERKLGEGGFGEVWLGRDKVLKTRHVFKFCFRADRVRSLKREVTLFRLLKERVGAHPNIVGIEATYFDEPPFYIVMRHVDGCDLPAWCEGRGGIDKVPLAVRLEIVAQIADALQAAHDSGVIHRDVKPTNILIGGGDTSLHAYLTDFGIGQVVSEEALAGVTRSGFTQTIIEPSSSRSGTQLYMAPELAAGRPASIRSDIYSLGVVLYQLIAGDFMHPVATDWAKHITDPLLRADLEQCFAGSPQDRFSGAGQLAEQLRTLERRRTALEEQQACAMARERAAYRRGIIRAAAVAGVVAATIALLAFYGFGQARRAETALEEVRQTLSRSDYLRAVDAINDGAEPEALAYLARAVRTNPRNGAAAELLVSSLGDQQWLLPAGDPVPLGDEVGIAVFDREGTRLFVSEGMDEWRILDLASGAVRAQGKATPARIGRAAFSPDGKRIAVVSGPMEANVLRIWDVQNGKALAGPITLKGVAKFVVFSPDGRSLLTAGGNKLIEYNAQTGAEIRPPIDHASPVMGAEFTPDGSRIVSAALFETFFWDATTRQTDGMPLKHDAIPQFLAISPGGDKLAIALADGTGRVFALSDRGTAGQPFAHGSNITGVRFSADGRLLLTSSNDRTSSLWNALDGSRRAQPMRHDQPVAAAAFAPGGTEILSVSGGQGKPAKLQRWRLHPPALSANLTHGARVLALSFSADGGKIATGSADGKVSVWDAQTRKLIAGPMAHNDEVVACAFSPDGGALVTAAGQAAILWEPVSAQSRGISLVHDGKVASVCFSPDGRRLLTASLDGVARLWNAADGKPEGSPMRHEDGVVTAEFSPDGKRILSGSNDGTARLWDAGTGKPIGEPMRHTAPVTVAHFSPDGRRAATGSKDCSARVWDGHTGRGMTPPLAHDRAITEAIFSTDSGMLVTAAGEFGGQGFARVWDVASGAPLTDPMPHPDGVVSASLHPDGDRLVTGAFDGMLRVLDLRTGSPRSIPIRFGAPIVRVQFSPHAPRLAVASGNVVVLLELVNSRPAAPDWLAKLAEHAGGLRFNPQGLLEPVHDRKVEELDRQLRAREPRDDYERFGHRFLSAPAPPPLER